MRHTTLLRASLAALGIALVPTFASAQRNAPSVPASSSIDLTPYAGYMMFGDLASGPLNTSLSNAPAPILGVQLGMRIAPNVSLIGNLAGSNSEIKAGVPLLGGLTIAETSMILYDVGLELRTENTSAYGYNFVPFFQAGIGGMHYEITQSMIETKATNLAGNLGIGADVKLGTGMSLRLMAKDYIGKFNFQDATSFDFDGGMTQNYALSAGLRLSF